MIGSVLSTFAQETKHKKCSESVLLKKLLATQCPGEWKNIYGHVSNDLSRIEYKAPDALEIYATSPRVPFLFYPELFEKYKIEQVPGFDCPHPSLFFCKNICKYDPKSFIDGLNKLCGGDRKAANQLYDNLVDIYDLPVDNLVIGEWIQSLEFSDAKVAIEAKPVEKERTAPSRKLEKFTESAPLPWTTEMEKSYRNDPIIVQYKLDKVLPTGTKSHKIAKELLLESDKMMGIIDYYTQDSIDTILNTKQAAHYYDNFLKMTTKQNFIKSLLKAEPWSAELAHAVANGEIKF